MQTMAISYSSSVRLTLSKSLGGILSLRYCHNLTSRNTSSVAGYFDNPIPSRVCMEPSFTQRLRCKGLSIWRVPRLIDDPYPSSGIHLDIQVTSQKQAIVHMGSELPFQGIGTSSEQSTSIVHRTIAILHRPFQVLPVSRMGFSP